MRRAYEVLVVLCERRPLGRPRHIFKNNIKKNLKKWIGEAETAFM
jgi:hypothetical protein